MVIKHVKKKARKPQAAARDTSKETIIAFSVAVNKKPEKSASLSKWEGWLLQPDIQKRVDN